MGAQWKNQSKSANAAQKGAVVHKLTKEIQVAAKLGQPDPDYNPRLRAAIEAAKKQSVTRDTIERAIKKGAGLDKDAATFETITYEGFAPHKVPVIVECLTDNKNRTASEIKVISISDGLFGPSSSSKNGITFFVMLLSIACTECKTISFIIEKRFA